MSRQAPFIGQRALKLTIPYKSFLPVVKMLSTSKCVMSNVKRHPYEVDIIAIAHIKLSFKVQFTLFFGKVIVKVMS